MGYRASSLLLLGRVLFAQAELAEARVKLLEAATLYQHLGNILEEAEAHSHLGRISLNLGQFEEAQTHLQLSIERTAAISSSKAKNIHATALNLLAGTYHQQGNAGDALRLLNHSLNLWQEEENITGQLQCLSNIGNIQNWLGQYGEAISTLSNAYRIYQSHPQDSKTEIHILHNLATAHHLNGDNTLAIKMMESAHQTAVISRSKFNEAAALLNLGGFCLQDEQWTESLRYLQDALRLTQQLGYQVLELEVLDTLGSLYQKTGEHDLARQSYAQALEMALSIGSTQGELNARLHLGQLHLTGGQLEQAREELRASLGLAVQAQFRKEEASAHEALSELYKRLGWPAEALEHSEQLRRIERELFDAERDRQTRNLTIQFEVERARRDADVYRMRTEVEHEARRTAERLVQERTAELARAQHEVVTRLAMAAEYRDDTTGEHTWRVGHAVTHIARALGWPDARAELLGIAARLHDVGKIGIPDSILLKPGKLTPAEYVQMQTHTLIGARILSGGLSELLRLSEEIALTHHERWDGKGYPRGLGGPLIPISGRIVAVADVYDALTQERPYKRAWTHEEALHELEVQAGTQFDPDVVRVALEVLQGGLAATEPFRSVRR
nr:HD domain-containing phosphohydrolase [Deinococcus hopiensis]